MITYRQLKHEFRTSEPGHFAAKYAKGDARQAAIRALAFAKNDNGWPLGILQAIQPDLAHGLEKWSAGGYEEIRRAQEAGQVAAGSTAARLESGFVELPIWGGRATHASKSLRLFEQLRRSGVLQLRSFMGCCAPGHTFAYAQNPASTLHFTKLRSARLVGALTTENLEREVLLPPGASFRVADVDSGKRMVTLHEI